MNHSSMNHSSKSQILFWATVATAFLLLLQSANAAVTIESTVTAKDPNATVSTPLTLSNTPSGGTLNPVSGIITSGATTGKADRILTGNAPISVSSKGDGPSVYGFANPSYSSLGSVTKTDPVDAHAKAGFVTNTTRKVTATADPLGPDTFILQPLPGGTPNSPVQMQFSFPTGNLPAFPIDAAYPFSQHYGGAEAPSQAVLRDNAGLNPTDIGNFFDVLISVNASVKQGSSTTPLFTGTAVLGANGQLTSVTGDFATFLVDTVTGTAPGGNPNAVLTKLVNLPTRPFTVLSSQPFDLTMDFLVQIGDPNDPNDFTPVINNLPRNLGAAASFTIRSELAGPDVGHYEFVAAPEPSSLVLVTLAAAGLAGYRLRCRR